MRILAISVLLLLVQACGGGGGGGGSSTLTVDECDGTNTPILDGGVCRAREARDCTDPTLPVFVDGTSPCEAADVVGECHSTLPFFHNGVCRERCPDTAPESTGGVCRPREARDCTDPTLPVFVDGTSPCEAADVVGECHSTLPFFHNGVCRERCPDTAPESTGGVCRPREARDCTDPTLPVFVDGTSPCEAADVVGECHSTLPFFHNGVCRERCPDTAPESTGGVCRPREARDCTDPTLPVFVDGTSPCEAADVVGECHSTLPFFHNGVCRERCPDTAPESTGGVCRPREARDCTDPTLPVFVDGTSPCEAADVVGECHSTLPFFHNGVCRERCPDTAPESTGGVCRPREARDCTDPTLPVFVDGTSPCEAADVVGECHSTLPFFHNGVCRERCPDTAPESTGGVCRPREARDCTDPTLPVFVDGTSPCEAADVVGECHSTLPFFHNGVCRERCPDTAPESTGGVCRPREARDCTDPTPDFVDGACVAACPTGEVRDDDNECRDRRLSDCTGTMPRLIDGTCVPFEASITTAQTAAYDGIFASAQNEPNFDSNTQAENCGDLCFVDFGLNQNQEEGIFRLRSVTIDIDGGGGDYILNQDLTPIVVARAEGAADRRFRPSEGLDEWTYRRYELRGSETAGDPSDVTGDIIEWNNTSDTYYLAGGVWAYDIGEPDMENPTDETRGAGALSNEGVSNADPFPAANSDVADATYVGHSFGHYAVLPKPDGDETNLGYFAAKARLEVDFTNPGQGVSGTISNFLFSEDRDFTTESPLEAALSGLSVALQTGDITRGSRVTFRGNTLATVGVDNATIDLTGKYGGFFVDPVGTRDDPGAPNAISGTWGAAGATDDTTPTTANRGFGISFIGAFGAKLEESR